MKQFTFLMCVLTISITFQSVSAEEIIEQPAPNAACGLSGIVVDTEGKPLSEFKFTIQSSQNINGNLQARIRAPIRPIVERQANVDQKVRPQSMITVKTDADGKFDVPNILPGQIQIMALPQGGNEAQEKKNPKNVPEIPHLARHLMFGKGESGIKLVSIRLNKLTFFFPEDPHRPFGNFRFGLKPNAKINDVKITVMKRMKIYAKVVYANGTPVANAEIDLDMDVSAGEFGTQGGGYRTNNFTDAKGYFLEYRDNPGYYTISVEHRGYKGGAGPFILTKDKEPENFVIKLDGSPAVKKKQPKEVNKELDKEKARNLVKGLLGKRNVRQPVIPQANFVPKKQEKIVWIINPANGHAYASVSCADWFDAQQKAIKEGAHLVSINNEDEQFWIEAVFQFSSFWIGLNDVEKEGEWRWDSGEPVTYTNWTTSNHFPDNSPDTEKDFVAMTFFEGGWQASGVNANIHRRTHTAVIEKDGLVSKVPKPEETEDE